jgi:hypothetical protein
VKRKYGSKYERKLKVVIYEKDGNIAKISLNELEKLIRAW